MAAGQEHKGVQVVEKANLPFNIDNFMYSGLGVAK